jgi:LemA protein
LAAAAADPGESNSSASFAKIPLNSSTEVNPFSPFMSSGTLLILIAGGVASLLLFTTVYFYNRLVKSRIQVREAVAGIDVQLKRRHDLIPNLAAVVRGHAQHNQALLQALDEVPEYAPGMSVRDKAKVETAVGRTLRNALDTARSLPQLAGSESFLQLQQGMVRVEDDLQMARRYYNALVREHNSLCETFPSGLLASMLGIKREPFFEVDDETAQNPVIG